MYGSNYVTDVVNHNPSVTHFYVDNIQTIDTDVSSTTNWRSRTGVDCFRRDGESGLLKDDVVAQTNTRFAAFDETQGYGHIPEVLGINWFLWTVEGVVPDNRLFINIRNQGAQIWSKIYGIATRLFVVTDIIDTYFNISFEAASRLVRQQQFLSTWWISIAQLYKSLTGKEFFVDSFTIPGFSWQDWRAVIGDGSDTRLLRRYMPPHVHRMYPNNLLQLYVDQECNTILPENKLVSTIYDGAPYLGYQHPNDTVMSAGYALYQARIINLRSVPAVVWATGNGGTVLGWYQPIRYLVDRTLSFGDCVYTFSASTRPDDKEGMVSWPSQSRVSFGAGGDYVVTQFYTGINTPNKLHQKAYYSILSPNHSLTHDYDTQSILTRYDAVKPPQLGGTSQVAIPPNSEDKAE
jgi:hypothetical protein